MSETKIEIEEPRVVILLATIPARRQSCTRLLDELMRQTRRPDGVVLVLDGYGDAPAPACQLPILAELRTDKLSGAGRRWSALNDLPPDNIAICLDDDVMLGEAPRLIESLVVAVQQGGAAAAMGRSADGKQAPPGRFSRGKLIYGAGCGLAVRARHLIGVEAFAAELQAAGGPDALGVAGDDDALVSAYLWKTNIPILHAATGNIYPAPGTRASSQTAANAVARRAAMTRSTTPRLEQPNQQKLAIKKITGWPWCDGSLAKGPHGRAHP